jgi:signal transduction histidine kinase
VYAVFSILIFIDSSFWFFIPVVLYGDILDVRSSPWIFSIFWLLGLAAGIPLLTVSCFVLLGFLSSLLNTALFNLENLSRTHYLQIDRLRYMNERMKSEQAWLIELQDSTLIEARNEERRRITSEIHDNLGHDLSASIIELAAMEYDVDDEKLKKRIENIRNLLSQGMNSVRKAIHNEHDQALDLNATIQSYVDSFKKADIKYAFHARTMPNIQVKHSLTSIIKEALTNINKHSNADKVSLRFQETANEWILLVADNGTDIKYSDKNTGLGLLNIEERVNRHRGALNISVENGFRIFVRIPKEGNC